MKNIEKEKKYLIFNLIIIFNFNFLILIYIINSIYIVTFYFIFYFNRNGTIVKNFQTNMCPKYFSQ